MNSLTVMVIRAIMSLSFAGEKRKKDISETVRTINTVRACIQPGLGFHVHFHHLSISHSVYLPEITNSINMYYSGSYPAQYLPIMDCKITTASTKARERLFYFPTVSPRRMLGSTAAAILNISWIIFHKEQYLHESKTGDARPETKCRLT